MGKRKIDKSEYEEIMDLYRSGLSQKQIAKIYSVNENTISKIVCSFGEPKRRNRISGTRKYNLNETYFDNIDTPNKAYIIGLLWADGSNSIKNHTISISLQEQDKDILVAVAKELESNCPLIFYNYKKKNPNFSNQYRLTIHSKYMSNTLEKLGMVQNKSIHLEFPTWLRYDLYSHFIRGYMDGDGWISKNSKAPRVEIVGTSNFCDGLSKYICEQFGIKCAIRKRYKESNSSVRQLDFGGRKQVKRFLDFIYNDSELFLQRKFDIYKSIFASNDINNSLSV